MYRTEKPFAINYSVNKKALLLITADSKQISTGDWKGFQHPVKKLEIY
jgi:hypothetical protein